MTISLLLVVKIIKYLKEEMSQKKEKQLPIYQKAKKSFIDIITTIILIYQIIQFILLMKLVKSQKKNMF